MRVQHNIPAMSSYRNYGNNTKAINKNLEKLSSGYKINRAGDDAAGLAISEKMRAQITGLEGAQKNAKDGISLVQTAEGALTEVHSMLNRMYSLAEQSANGTYDSTTDRSQLQKEVDQLRTEIDRIADGANFNGLKLLNGDLGGWTTDWGSGAQAKLHSNYITGITVSGGGGGDGPKTAMSNSFFTAKMSYDGENVTVTLKGASELKGMYLAPLNSAIGDENYLGGDNPGGGVATNTEAQATINGNKGGSITYRLYRDPTALSTDAYAADMAYYDGMEITVSVGAAAEDGDDADYAKYTDHELTFGVSDKKDNLRLQIGDTAESFNQLNVSIRDLHASKLGLNVINIGTQDAAGNAMSAIKAAINMVSDVRGTLGATQNRLEHTINNLSVMQENIQDAESTIRDTDVADEMMKYTKNSILVQSAQAMLAQANQQPQGVLQLLQ